MQPVTITTILDENHELFLKIKLPDMPPGPVEVVITPRLEDEPLSADPQTRREQMRAKLIAAGHLSNARRSPDAVEVSEEELERLRHVFAGERPLSEIIIEDREDRV
jgi:hypothetical protein